MIKSVTCKDLVTSHPHLAAYHLDLLERLNPCDQAYYLLDDQYFITYRLPINLLNFNRHLKLKVKCRVVGFPFSICHQGFRGNPLSLAKSIKGFFLVLNADQAFGSYGANTLSNYVFYNHYVDFDHYLNSLRSPYRYRLKKALTKAQNLVIKPLLQADFNQSHYALYEEVYHHSKDQLEKLSYEFFKTYPSDLTVFENKTGQALAFVQTTQFNDELFFLFGGFNRQANLSHDLYLNMLLYLIKLGINQDHKTINMGQTADESKLKVGCIEQVKHLSLRHSNPLIDGILKVLVPHFGFKPYPHVHHVFKEAPYADTPL